MLNLLDEHNDIVVFNEENHTYLHVPSNRFFISGTRVVGNLHEKFDTIGISHRCAISNLKAAGIPLTETNIKVEQASLINLWDGINKEAIERGKLFHKLAEDFYKKGILDPRIASIGKDLADISTRYMHVLSEKILFHVPSLFSGTADLVLVRGFKDSRPVIDIDDFKSNEDKINFDNYNEDHKKFFTKFMYSPIDYLEDTVYNHYVVQLNLYAYMAELTFGAIIGRLGLRVVNKDWDKLSYIPIPYNRYIGQMLIEKRINYLKKTDKDIKKGDIVEINEQFMLNF